MSCQKERDLLGSSTQVRLLKDGVVSRYRFLFNLTFFRDTLTC